MDELTRVPEHETPAPRVGSAFPEVDVAEAAPAHTDKRWVENAPSRTWLPRLDLAELWESRELVLVLALRNVKVRYKQTALGVGWTLLQPLTGVVIFTAVMHRIAHLPSEGIPYPVFAYSGLAVWLYFTNGTTAAADSLAQYRDLVTKVYFPRLLAPLAAVMPGLIDLAISIVAVGVFMVVFHVTPTAAIVLLPLWVTAAVGTTFAIGVWLSALNTRYRDVRNGLTFLLQILLFATPVLYPSSLVHGPKRFLLYLSPIAGVVDGFRWSLVGAPGPGGAGVVSLVAGLVVLLSGLIYFGRVQRRFADYI